MDRYERTIGDARLTLITSLSGHQIFVPEDYVNLLSYLKAGCPLWIRDSNASDVFQVIILDSDDWEGEALRFISSYYK